MSAAHTLPAMEPTLFNPQTGRLDAGRIAREFNVPVAIIAEAIGRRAPGVRKSPDASSLQGGLRRLYRIWVALLELYAGDKTNARIFLNAPNRNLENQAPIEFIQNGDLTPLELFVDAGLLREAKPGLAYLTGRLLEEGTQTRSAEALATGAIFALGGIAATAVGA